MTEPRWQEQPAPAAEWTRPRVKRRSPQLRRNLAIALVALLVFLAGAFVGSSVTANRVKNLCVDSIENSPADMDAPGAVDEYRELKQACEDAWIFSS